MKLEIEITDALLTQIAERVAVILRVGKASTYTVGEAAAILGVCKKTITRRIEAKLIPSVPNIRPPRIPADFIDRAVTTNPRA
ncbi:MAG: helix-turn-helix domain-containing protein [Luteolibacter sp.]